MSTVTVFDVVGLPGSRVNAGDVVKLSIAAVELDGMTPKSITSYRNVTTSAAGRWEAEFDILTDGNYYVATYPDATELRFNPTASDDPLWIGDCLVEDPAKPSGIQLAGIFVPQSDTAPDPAVSLVWADTSTEPPVVKGWDGSAWVEIGGGGGGALTSVFGRAGVVVALAGDYAAFYDTSGAAATVQGHLDTEAAARASGDALLIPLTQKGAASGVAPLDSNQLVPRANIPVIKGVFDIVGVANQAAMLALTQPDADTQLRVQRTDTPGVQWVLNPGLTVGTIGNWIQEPFDASGAAAAAQAAAIAAAATDATTKANNAVTTSEGYADGKVEDSVQSGHHSIAPSGAAVATALAGKADSTEPIGAAAQITANSALAAARSAVGVAIVFGA